MYLYRICSREEYDIIEKDKSFKNLGIIGSMCESIDSGNEIIHHLYHPELSYIHFYGDIKNIYYDEPKKGDRMYVIDINEEKISETGILFNYSKICIGDVIEFAINVDVLSYDDIVSIREVTKDISFSNIDHNGIYERLKTIYSKDKPYQKKKS